MRHQIVRLAAEYSGVGASMQKQKVVPLNAAMRRFLIKETLLDRDLTTIRRSHTQPIIRLIYSHAMMSAQPPPQTRAKKCSSTENYAYHRPAQPTADSSTHRNWCRGSILSGTPPPGCHRRGQLIALRVHRFVPNQCVDDGRRQRPAATASMYQQSERDKDEIWWVT